MNDEQKGRGLIGNPQNQNYYGTFQGVMNYYPPFSQAPPQPISPPVTSSYPLLYGHRYQTFTGYAVFEGRPLREDRPPCCGIGMGWFLFVTGFFLGGIPWYVGAFIALCVQVDYREKPGYVACAIAWDQYASVSLFNWYFGSALAFLAMHSFTFLAVGLALLVAVDSYNDCYNVWRN